MNRIDGRTVVCLMPFRLGFSFFHVHFVEAKIPEIMMRTRKLYSVCTGYRVVDCLFRLLTGSGSWSLEIVKQVKVPLPWPLPSTSWIITSSPARGIVFCCLHFCGPENDEHDAILWIVLRVLGIRRHFSVVAAAVTDSMAAQFVCPMSGTCCSEYGRNSGFSALISYDDLSKHAVAYRQLSLFLRKPAGREAYPSDVFICILVCWSDPAA